IALYSAKADCSAIDLKTTQSACEKGVLVGPLANATTPRSCSPYLSAVAKTDALPKALPRNLTNSGASENSLRQTALPVCQTRPIRPSFALTAWSRRKLSRAIGLEAACCRICCG